MGVEIMGKISYAKCDFYFGYIDKLTGDEHKEAAVKEIAFILKKLDFLFFDSETLIMVMENINSLDRYITCDKKNECTINRNSFFDKLKTIIGNIYDSNIGFKIKSEKLYIDIYFDPVDIQFKYTYDI